MRDLTWGTGELVPGGQAEFLPLGDFSFLSALDECFGDFALIEDRRRGVD